MSSKVMGIVWAGIFVLLALVVAQPVGLQAQFLFALLGITIMFVVKHFSARGIWRQIFLLVGVVIVYRYLYWRVTSTLPQPSDLANFIPGVLLFIAELYSITMLAVNMVVVADPISRKKEPLHGDPKDYPSVDIYVPSYNEDLDIVGVTLAAARNIDYPADKLNVYLLDDGGSDQRCNSDDMEKRTESRERREVFGKFCRELGVGYVTRARNEHAKAGNMNEALKSTNGELILVLDADHAPSRDFLKKTVGYFQADSNLFLVQTPHQFLNPDPVEKNIGTFERMPSENEMFYHVTQKGLDKWNGSFFCGSAALLRRAALMEVGGFAGVSITEDCETAVEMHALGWNSAYVDEPMVAGFQPETFASFISQRSRWCQGMLQILILKGPAFRTDMKLTQRLAYMSIMLNWLFPMSRFMFMIAPAFFILFDLHIYNASFDEFIAYTLFSLFASAMMQNYMFGTVRWPWMSELYEYVQCYHLSRAIVSVIRNPTAPTFDVTNKAETLETDYYSEVGWFHLIMFGILGLTCVVGGYRMMMESGTNELLYVVGFWAMFNLLIAGLGLGAVSEKRQRRRHYRMPYTAQQVRGVLQIGNQKTHVMIRDMAIGGLSFGLADGAEPVDTNDLTGKKARLHLVRGRRKDDKLLHTFNLDLRWSARQGGTQVFGAEFDNPGPLDRRAQALLMYPTSEALAQYRKNRVKNINVAGGTGEFLAWSLFHTIRGLKAATGFLKAEIREKLRRGKDEDATDVAEEAVAEEAQPEVPVAGALGAPEHHAEPQMIVPQIAASAAAMGASQVMVHAGQAAHAQGMQTPNQVQMMAQPSQAHGAGPQEQPLTPEQEAKKAEFMRINQAGGIAGLALDGNTQFNNGASFTQAVAADANQPKTLGDVLSGQYDPQQNFVQPQMAQQPMMPQQAIIDNVAAQNVPPMAPMAPSIAPSQAHIMTTNPQAGQPMQQHLAPTHMQAPVQNMVQQQVAQPYVAPQVMAQPAVHMPPQQVMPQQVMPQQAHPQQTFIQPTVTDAQIISTTENVGAHAVEPAPAPISAPAPKQSTPAQPKSAPSRFAGITPAEPIAPAPSNRPKRSAPKAQSKLPEAKPAAPVE